MSDSNQERDNPADATTGDHIGSGSAEETLRAIRRGEVDAFLMGDGQQDRVLIVEGADQPYRLLVDRMQQGAVTLTADGTIAFANRRFAELVDASLDQLPGTLFATFVHTEDRPLLAAILQPAPAGSGTGAVRLLRTNCSTTPVHLAASSLVDGRITCLMVTDLTEQMRLEKERVRFAEERAARDAAEQTAASLREADRQKDVLLAMLAHELRNPLGPIRYGIQILNQTDSENSERQGIRDIMMRQVNSLIRLVDDLLDAGRITQGKINLRKKVVDLRDVVEQAVESCRRFVDERGHELRVVLPDEHLPAEIDVDRIVQALVNVLNNAAKFTPSGGRIALMIDRDGSGAATIRILDNGAGIAPDVLPSVFTLFAQGQATAAQSDPGLGIGLTLARRLTEMHGGTLDGASAGLGLGSEFTFRLPLLDAALGASASAAAQPDRNVPSELARRILIVDDNTDAASSLALLLRLSGHDVRVVDDGDGAVAAALEFIPDTILLDLGLPGRSGFEIAQLLRAEQALGGTQLIALTGYGSADDRRRSRESGFDAHLVKPVGLVELKRFIALPTPTADS